MTIIKFPELMLHLSDTLLPRLEHLQLQIKHAGKCCDLKSITFEGGQVPDYSIEVIQDLYMLRYYGAYLCEYREIYDELLNFIEEPIFATSLGAGSGVDLAALYFEASKRGLELGKIRWRGYDLIPWSHRVQFPEISAKYRDCSISDIDHLPPQTNVMFFPKSISEFDHRAFADFLEIMRKSDFQRDKLALASSIRAHDYSTSLDCERFGKVAEVFLKDHGYESEDNANRFWKFKNENVAWSTRYRGFSVPDDVVNYLRNLAERCPTRIRQHKACKQECDNILSRSPMLRANTVRFQIMRLSR